MSRAPSDATLLRTAKAEIKALVLLLRSAEGARETYRVRASKAEQECVEWKARFDLLLRQPVQIRGPDYYRPITPSSADPLPALPTSICKE